MDVVAALILGIIIGWVAEWAVDWFYWRRKNEALTEELSAAKTQLSPTETEDGQYEDQVASLESARQQLESSSAGLQSQVSSLETEKADLLLLVTDLRSENETIKKQMATLVASLKDDLKEIYGVGPVVEAKLNSAGVYKFRDLAALDPNEFRSILGPDTERPINEEKIISLAGLAARATENVRGDDLQAINGVGPVITGLLNQSGVFTYADLGGLTQEQLEVILGEYIEHLSDEADIIQQARNLAGMDT